MDDQNPKETLPPANPPEPVTPLILNRGEHPISRRDIDPDVFKIVYRLHEQGFTCYLVGGAVRDLLLGKQPKDFDMATDARPGQIKKRFRNAFLIGRRFRLAHVHFAGGKIIEVATFRRDPKAGEPQCELPEARETERPPVAEAEGSPSLPPSLETQEILLREEEALPVEEPEPDAEGSPLVRPRGLRGRPAPEHLNIYGTPAEDAFRRDTTINGLFFDVITSSVIDYVGGLEDLARRKVRIIGDPAERYKEDPVRVWRVIRQAARLRFEIEDETARAIPSHRQLLASCSGSRLYEELNKELTGETMPVIEGLARHGLLPFILGKIGSAYVAQVEWLDRLLSLLQAKDRAAAAGVEFSLEELYALLLWPWVESVFGPAEGDLQVLLKNAYAGAGIQAVIPKALMAGVIQIQVILAALQRALHTGNMRWSLRGRPHFPQASRLFFLIAKLRMPEPHETFSSLYAETFPGKPAGKRKRRRRRKPRLSPLGHPSGEPEPK